MNKHTAGPWFVVEEENTATGQTVIFRTICRHSKIRNAGVEVRLCSIVGRDDADECKANAALMAAAPETAAERDRIRIVNAELINALELAAKYLGKAVAENLMSDCVRSPRYALMIANRALANAQVNWPKCEASLAELVEKWNEDDHE